jgi:hypothetical protein
VGGSKVWGVIEIEVEGGRCRGYSCPKGGRDCPRGERTGGYALLDPLRNEEAD